MAEEIFDHSRSLLDPLGRHKSVFELGWLVEVSFANPYRMSRANNGSGRF
jgi:hypothetical protein